MSIWCSEPGAAHNTASASESDPTSADCIVDVAVGDGNGTVRVAFLSEDADTIWEKFYLQRESALILYQRLGAALARGADF